MGPGPHHRGGRRRLGPRPERLRRRRPRLGGRRPAHQRHGHGHRRRPGAPQPPVGPPRRRRRPRPGLGGPGRPGPDHPVRRPDRRPHDPARLERHRRLRLGRLAGGDRQGPRRRPHLHRLVAAHAPPRRRPDHRPVLRPGLRARRDPRLRGRRGAGAPELGPGRGPGQLAPARTGPGRRAARDLHGRRRPGADDGHGHGPPAPRGARSGRRLRPALRLERRLAAVLGAACVGSRLRRRPGRARGLLALGPALAPAPLTDGRARRPPHPGGGVPLGENAGGEGAQPPAGAR